MNITYFNKLSLKNMIDDINEQEFEYGSVSGRAQIWGYKIVLFRRRNVRDTSALNIAEINICHKQEIYIANMVISNLDMGVKFGDGIDLIKKIYGEPFLIDRDTRENAILYHYCNSPKLYICFILERGKLTHLEIIRDEEIISDRLEVIMDGETRFPFKKSRL